MVAMRRYINNNYVRFFLGCLIVIGILHSLFIGLEEKVSSFSPLLFPMLTIFLLVFHLFIACFMVMKYWCDRQRLYLLAFAFAYVGSAILMVGTLSSYPAWLDQHQFNVVNYNDAMIFFTFRHLLMSVLFIASGLLYFIRNRPLTRTFHLSVIVGATLFTGMVVTLAWFYSSYSPLLSIDLVDNETRQYMLLWKQEINIVLILFWVVSLATLMIITRVRNMFWVGGIFYVSAISQPLECCIWAVTRKISPGIVPGYLKPSRRC